MKRIVFLLFLIGAANAYNLTFSECISVVNATNETVTICAPSYPQLNQTINLGFSDTYRNDGLNLSVTAPAANTCPNCTVCTTCPPLREIEWLISYNQTRIAENVSKITITGPPMPSLTCPDYNCSNSTNGTYVYINNCTNITENITVINQTSCPTLHDVQYIMMPGQSTTQVNISSGVFDCLACPAQPNTTYACPNCPSWDYSQCTKNCTDPAQATPQASVALTFIGEGNCTVKATDQQGQLVCLDSREKYCSLACQELRASYNQSMMMYLSEQNKTQMCLDTITYMKSGGEIFTYAAMGMIVVFGAAFVKWGMDRNKGRQGVA